jgi:hypothetical protein
MARYYFHVEGQPDDSGMALLTSAEAKCDAVRCAAKLICDEAERFWDAGQFTMTVTDGTGPSLFALVLSGIEAPSIRMTEKVQHSGRP